MAEAASSPHKLDPETLALRAAPRRIVRLKRKLLIGVAAVGALAIFGLVGLALKAPSLRLKSNGQELYNTDRKPMADGLATLPNSYAQVPKRVPELGPPLPGDLGKPIVEQQKALGLRPEGEGGFSPNAAANEAQAERVRLAQQARQAHEAGVFFPISRQGQAAGQNQSTSLAGQEVGSAMTLPAPNGADGRLNLDLNRDQNNQQRKLDFVNQAGDQNTLNRYPLKDAVSPYEVLAGSTISASLITGINSDLPGLVVAQVTEPVYDTVSGRFLLIPQGARLIGTYDSVVAFHQSRALLVWQRIVMPDGSSIQIENLPATDTAGYAGLEDQVDYHTWALLKGVVLSTILGVGTELSLGNEQSDLVRAIEESTQQNVNRAGQQITEKNLQIQPTIRIRPGWSARIVVSKDLILRPYRD